MRQARFMFAAVLTGAVVLVAVLFAVIAAAFALGGREWTEHFGEDHWQTYAYMFSAAAISGLAMLPVIKFWQRRI